ncbi:MAG: Endolytic murein transglycosylase [Desulfovibrio sp.]
MTDTPATVPPPLPPKKSGGFLKKFLLLLLALLVGGGGAVAYDAYTFLNTPGSSESRDVTIDIQPGATFDRVAWDLYKENVITNVPRFRILAQYKGQLGSIKAGEFMVNTNWTPEQVLTQLTSGRAVLYRLAIREGLPWWEVARLVEEGGFAKADEFEAVIHDPEFLRQYGIPFANAEGFLYPETYLLRKPRTLGGREQAESVARILVESFWKRTWKALENYAATDTGSKGSPILLPDFTVKNGVPVRVAPRPANVPDERAGTNAPQTVVRERITRPPLQAPVSAETLRYLVILGSLVEKETGVPAERARVAGVYANRMRIGMLLQCDPTIIYGLGKTQKGPIRRSQLDDEKNLYNTYKHSGLPPGPICSPGAAAMQAAVNPESHSYIFFVATGKPDGTHTFSTNLRDHEKAVRVFRATQGR